MKFKLPIVGQIKTGKDLDLPLPTITSIETPKSNKSLTSLGGLLNFATNALSNERTISKKILDANKEWVYRNNDVIAQEVSKIEFELFSVNLRGGEIEYDPIEDHPLLDVLDMFNSRTTKMDGIYTTQSHKKLTGDAFWYLQKNGKTVESIHILQPDKIEIDIAEATSDDLIAGYIYTDTINGKYVQTRYDIDEIIHFKKPNPKNPFRGYGAVEAIADTIDADNLTNETQRNFFDKGAISNFVLTTDANVTDEQLKRMKAEMRSYQGARNAFSTMIFGNGLKPADIGFSNKDMEFLNLLEWYRDKIMIGFGNTKSSIGIIDDVNRASFEGSHTGWLVGTIKPDMDSIVNTLNEFFVPLYGDNLVLGYKNPVPEDATSEIQEAVQLKSSGIIQINEARQKVGLEPIEGGDIFAPTGGVAVPGGDSVEEAKDPNAPQDEEPVIPTEEEQKRFYRRPATHKNKKINVPASLSHLDIAPLLRKRGIMFKKKLNKSVKEAMLPYARESIKKKKAKAVAPEETPIHSQFTNEQVNAYYEKQMKTVDALQEQFLKKVLKILGIVEAETISNLNTEVKSIKGLQKFVSKKKELFDQADIQAKAELDLTPILMQEIIVAGQAAFDLIGFEDTYVPYKIEDSVRDSVKLFAKSMTDTDMDYLTNIIEDGIKAGDSITDIRDAIKSKFGEYTKVQAERIARTEVLRASNMAAEDAFIQSGVVEAKQWLLAPNACPLCIPYSGKVVKLGKSFYDSDSSGFQNGNPPLHVNCRCVLVPIVEGTKSFEQDNTKMLEEMAAKVKELESKVDKRTKAFKQLKAESLAQSNDDKVYIQALEKHLGVSDGE